MKKPEQRSNPANVDRRQIYCVACQDKVEARLTFGGEIYPHRKDLSTLPFWKCDRCGNHVGCHHKTQNWTQPLGCIPTKNIRRKRMAIHSLLDRIWKEKRMTRKELYAEMAKRMGKKAFHVGALNSDRSANQAHTHAFELYERFFPE